MNLTESQTQLSIQKGIRQKEDNLVTLIQTALDKTNTYGDLDNSQFRNLLRVAQTTESSEVVKNFLRYQVGRKEDNKPDKWGCGAGSLAETIIQHINDELKKAANQIATESKAPEEQKSIHIQLIRLYLGYGSRYLKYLRDGRR